MTTTDANRIPHSVEAEETVLGALLIDMDNIVRVAHLLQPGDFFSEQRGAIYKAVLDRYLAGCKIDIFTVRDELRRHELLGTADHQIDPGYLSRLIKTEI